MGASYWIAVPCYCPSRPRHGLSLCTIRVALTTTGCLPRDNTQLATCSTCRQLLPTHLTTAVKETAWWAQGPAGSDSPTSMAQKSKGRHNPCQVSSKGCLLKPGMTAVLHMDLCALASLQSLRAKGRAQCHAGSPWRAWAKDIQGQACTPAVLGTEGGWPCNLCLWECR